MGSLSSCYLGADNIQALEFSLLAAFVLVQKDSADSEGPATKSDEFPEKF